MSDFVAFLRAAGAHHDVVSWVEASAPTLENAFATCPRGDWLLAIAARVGVRPNLVARAGSACARLALEDLDLPRASAVLDALDVALADDAPPERLEALKDEAEAAASAANDAAATPAWLAVAAACHARAEPLTAAMSAAFAVEVAVAIVGDCAMMSAVMHTQRRTADTVRSVVTAADLPALPHA